MWLAPSVKKVVQKALCYSDLDAHLRFSDRGLADMRQYCQLGDIFNDVECPGLTFDFICQTVSFEWKSFLDNFFSDYAYVWYRLRKTKTGLEATELILADNAQSNFNQNFNVQPLLSDKKILDWGYKFGEEHDRLFIQAYVERLKNSHAKAGQTLHLRCARNGSNENDFMRELRAHINRRRTMRNSWLLRRFER